MVKCFWVSKMILEIFGNRVKEVRNELLISQLELSERSGIERAQISKIEKGKINVTLETIEKLSNAFNMEISKLLNISSDNFLIIEIL